LCCGYVDGGARRGEVVLLRRVKFITLFRVFNRSPTFLPPTTFNASMSEYWKSTPKYWCKHCQTFVTDTLLGRKNHDTTAKHQLAIKRFLRDIHRDNERNQTAAENAKREVARLNALVSGGGGTAAASSSTASPVSVAKPEQKKGERWGLSKRELTEDERKQQMKELEGLGVAMPEQFRGDLALPGEWTVVAVEKPMSVKEKVKRELVEEREKELKEEENKRKWDEMDEDEKAIKSFKIQERTYPGAQHNVEDMDVKSLFAKKGTEKVEMPAVKEKEGENAKLEAETKVKREPVESPPGIAINTKEGADATVKTEEDAPLAGGGVVFKKRKVKSMRKKD
jgi:hypothetical protein